MEQYISLGFSLVKTVTKKSRLVIFKQYHHNSVPTDINEAPGVPGMAAICRKLSKYYDIALNLNGRWDL